MSEDTKMSEAIVFRRVSAGLYRAETEAGGHLATIRDTGHTRRYRADSGRRYRFARWQSTTPSGAGIGMGADTLAGAKEAVRYHYGVQA